MKILFFAPTRFEVPSSYRKKTKSFGIGSLAAQRLAKKLNQDQGNSKFVIFGCAGALRSQLRAGDTLVIRSLTDGSKTYEVNAKGTTTLFTSPHILSRPVEKALAHKMTGAQMVDMESFHFWEAASEQVRARCVFIRGVVDEAEDSIDFIVDGRLQWKKLLNVQQMKAFLKFLNCILIYRKGMQAFLQKWESLNS